MEGKQAPNGGKTLGIDQTLRFVRWRQRGGILRPEYLARAELTYLQVRLSHRSVFGTELDIGGLIERLRKMPRSAMLIAISRLALRMGAANIADSRVQRAIISEVLHDRPVTADRVCQLLEGKQNAIAFSALDAMILAKLVLLYSPGALHGPDDLAQAFRDLPELLLAAGDALDAQVTRVYGGMDEMDSADWLCNHAIRIMAFSNSPFYGNDVARYSRMLLSGPCDPRLSGDPDWIDIPAAFERLTGHGLANYLRAHFALAGLLMPTAGSRNPVNACFSRQRIVRNLPNEQTRRVVRDLLQQLATPAHRFRDAFAFRDPADVAFYFDYAPLERTPLIGIPGGLLCCIRPEWFGEAASGEVYWRLRDSLDDEFKQRFSRFMGRLFQVYVGDLLGASLPKGSVCPVPAERRRKAADYVVFDGENALFVEVATAHLQRRRTETEASPRAVQRDLEELGRKAKQALSSISCFLKGTATYRSHLPSATRYCWPVVVTLHHVPVDPLNLQRLREEAASAATADPRMLPPVFVDIGELEGLCSAVESGRTMGGVVRAWQSDPKHKGWSLRNFLYAQGLGRQMVSLLRDELRCLVTEAAKTVFDSAIELQ